MWRESVNLVIKKKTACFRALAAVCVCVRANESRGGWSVVGPCGGVMESSSGFGVECVCRNAALNPQQVLLLFPVAHVGGRAGPGPVACSSSPLNLTVRVGGPSCHQDSFTGGFAEE